jgi:hypothetical protein
MLQLVVCCFHIVAVTYGNKCHDGDFKIITFFVKSGEKEMSLLDDVGDTEKYFEQKNVVSCPTEQACFAYSVLATFTVVAGKNHRYSALSIESNNDQATIGRLELEAQTCLKSSTDSNENLLNNTCCDGWKERIREVFRDMNILVRDLVTDLSPVMHCSDECINLGTDFVEGKMFSK